MLLKLYHRSIGLSSHHGIHSNAASNVSISNIKIFDFEVRGIQFIKVFLI